MTEGKFIAYYRVSTDRQGKSGLGLEAQRKAVLDYLNGGGWVLIDSYTEVESGKRNDRPQLRAAIDRAKRERATLLVAKMDRLGRRASYVLNLLDNSGVDFKFTEMPYASELEIGIRAVVAQEEGRMISQRTKAALQAAKTRGVLLGKTGVERARENREKADQHAEGLRTVVAELATQGVVSVRRVADALNAQGIPTAKGGRWHPTSAARLLKRLKD